jgi:hypothetical protein
MFFQICKRHTPFLAFHQFSPTLPIIWAQVAEKLFFAKIQDGGPLKFQKTVQRANTRGRPVGC